MGNLRGALVMHADFWISPLFGEDKNFDRLWRLESLGWTPRCDDTFAAAVANGWWWWGPPQQVALRDAAVAAVKSQLLPATQMLDKYCQGWSDLLRPARGMARLVCD